MDFPLFTVRSGFDKGRLLAVRFHRNLKDGFSVQTNSTALTRGTS